MIDPRVQTLVRECRNMQLHVLLVLWASPEPLLVKELAQVINCSTDAVGEALPNLEFNGYVAQFPGGRHPRWWLTDKARQLVLPGLMLRDDTGKTGVSSAIKLPDSLNPQVVAALKAAGIGRNLHAELCALDHVTPAYVTAHDAYRRARGESTGMLITRLRCGDAVPTAITVKSSRPKIMRR